MTPPDVTPSDLTPPDLANRLDVVMPPDPRRVIIKLFVPGEDAAVAHTRTADIIDRITRLSDDEIGHMLEATLRRFGARHHDLETTLRHHYDLVHYRVSPRSDLSPTAQMLVGAYFSHEYSVEAAALCNPSMFPHPDQSALDAYQLRVVISVRQIGEGHISSIGFVTGVLGPGATMTLADRSGPLLTGHRGTARHRRDVFAAGLADQECDNEISATVLGSIPEHFDDDDFELVLSRIPTDLLTRGATHGTLDQMRRIVGAGYTVTFPSHIPLEQRVLWPTATAESNGMEDARFVRFTDDDGQSVYHATYTAFDGRNLGSRMLSTGDLENFEVTALRGPATRNKGMALFPRTVGGRHLALCRSDGETLGLAIRDEQSRWQHLGPVHIPRRSWELIQVGNCGSPLETADGWLVLTHGVGPMRRYAIGALLLDLDHPERVIAELPGELLAPDENERNGYVPNVVYSCGATLYAGALWIPYGISDDRIGFASIDLAKLIGAMTG